MTTLLFGVQSSLPSVPYIKAVDLFMIVSFANVFAALVEFAVVNYTSMREKERKESKPSKNTKNKYTVVRKSHNYTAKFSLIGCMTCKLSYVYCSSRASGVYHWLHASILFLPATCFGALVAGFGLTTGYGYVVLIGQWWYVTSSTCSRATYVAGNMFSCAVFLNLSLTTFFDLRTYPLPRFFACFVMILSVPALQCKF